MAINGKLACRAAVLAVAGVALVHSTASAQYGGNGGAYGQQGGYGQQGAYGGGYGQQGAYGGAGGFGGGGLGGGGFGGGGAGGLGMTPTSFGGFGQGGAFGQQGGGFGQQGGFGVAGQRNFVGRDATEVQNSFQGQFGQNPQGRFGFSDNIQNFNDLREQRRRGRDQENVAPSVRVQLRPAFDLPVAAPGALQAGVQARLANVMQARGKGQAQVTMTGGVTVLTGVVATEHDRALIARVVSLEPGVGPIDNRLTVAAPANGPATPIAPQ